MRQYSETGETLDATDYLSDAYYAADDLSWRSIVSSGLVLAG